FQFDCKLAQKDVIGEWVPLSEPGPSDVTDQSNGTKWVTGITWNEIDHDLILRHCTSSKNEKIEIDLRYAPMVIEELRHIAPDLIVENETTKQIKINRHLLSASGPMIIAERERRKWLPKRPWLAHDFRRRWRQIADACDVPKGVKNTD